MEFPARKQMRLSGGTQLAYVSAGDASAPAVLLLHGFPSSANSFRDIIPALATVAHVIAPDLPGYGASEPLDKPSFATFGETMFEQLVHLDVGPRHVYLHDYGAPVGLHVAMSQPDALLGLIIQNANAHRTGFGPQWQQTIAYWSHPDAENETAATAHLTFEGTREQYIAGVPDDVAARISPEVWEEDWRIMCLPGRRETQRALIADYGNYVSRFDAIARFLAEQQPPAVMAWGRHDAFFAIAETVSWMQDVPRMEAHVLDGGHMLLETHARPAAEIFLHFIQSRTRRA